MTSTIPLVLVVSFWLLIYIRRHYVLSSVQRPLLPVALSVHPRRSTHALWTLRDYAEVDLTSPFILRGKTSLFVDSHASLLEILGGTSTESTTPSLRRLTKPTRFYGWDLGSIVKIFYNLGSVTTVVGQILGLGVLWWSLLQLGLHLQGSSDLSSSLTHNMAKRSPVVVNQPLNPSPNQFLLRPLVSPRWQSTDYMIYFLYKCRYLDLTYQCLICYLSSFPSWSAQQYMSWAMRLLLLRRSLFHDYCSFPQFLD